MTGEEAYEALNPKHRAVVDFVSPTTTAAEAYRQVYGCSPSSAKRAAARLMSENVIFRQAVDKRQRQITEKAVERAVERATFDLGMLLDRVAEMVMAKSGKKLQIEDGRVTVIPPGILRGWVDLGLKTVAGGLLGSDETAERRREVLLPASLPREDADELFAKAREAGTLPGLIRPKDDDERVVIVEQEQDEDAVPVIQHPALVAVGGGG